MVSLTHRNFRFSMQNIKAAPEKGRLYFRGTTFITQIPVYLKIR